MCVAISRKGRDSYIMKGEREREREEKRVGNSDRDRN